MEEGVGGNVLVNGVVVRCGGVGGKLINFLLYARLEPYTKVQIYHVSLFFKLEKSLLYTDQIYNFMTNMNLSMFGIPLTPLKTIKKKRYLMMCKNKM